MLPDDAVVLFAGVTMDLRAAQLRRGQEALPLRPKSFDVLAYFVRHRRRLVPRLELLQAAGRTSSSPTIRSCSVSWRFDASSANTTLLPRCAAAATGSDAPVVVVEREPPLGVAQTLADVSSSPEPRADAPLDVPPHAAPASGAAAESAPTRPQTRWFVAIAVLALLGLGAWTAWTRAWGQPCERCWPAARHRVDGPRRHPAVRGSAHPDAAAVEGLAVASSGAPRSGNACRSWLFFPPAWAELSRTLTLLHIFGSAASPTVLPRAKSAAERAIALDPTLAEGHSALGHVLEQYDRNWATAEASHRRAIALAPRLGTQHQSYSLFLVSRLRVTEALSEMALAESLSIDKPTHPVVCVAWF